jgi:hypothetical protein
LPKPRFSTRRKSSIQVFAVFSIAAGSNASDPGRQFGIANLGSHSNRASRMASGRKPDHLLAPVGRCQNLPSAASLMRDSCSASTASSLACRPARAEGAESSVAPGCPGCDGPVTGFDLPDAGPVGYAEGYEAGRIIESPAEMAKLILLFVLLVDLAPRGRAVASRIRAPHHRDPR